MSINWEGYMDYFNKIGKNSNNILVINNFLEESDRAKILDYLNTHKDNPDFIGGKDIRQEQVAKENSFVYDLVKKYESKIYDEIEMFYGSRYGTHVKEIPWNDLHFVKWIPGMASKPHSDCQHPNGDPLTNSSYYRLNISALIYPNDDYEGGRISFVDYDVDIKPKAGDLVIFPSNNYYTHEVTEVLSGTRYTMPIWFTFDIETQEITERYDPKDSIGLWVNPEDIPNVSM